MFALKRREMSEPVSRAAIPSFIPSIFSVIPVIRTEPSLFARRYSLPRTLVSPILYTARSDTDIGGETRRTSTAAPLESFPFSLPSQIDTPDRLAVVSAAHVLVKIRDQFRAVMAVRALESWRLTALVQQVFAQALQPQEHARAVRAAYRPAARVRPPGGPEN